MSWKFCKSPSPLFFLPSLFLASLFTYAPEAQVAVRVIAGKPALTKVIQRAPGL